MTEQTQTKTNSEFFTFQDVLDTQARKGMELPIEKKYDPIVFWEDMARKYYESFKDPRQFQAHIAWISDRLRVLKIESLLDLGSGFGRVLPFLFDQNLIKNAVAFDIMTEGDKCLDEYLAPSGKDESVKDFRPYVSYLKGDLRDLRDLENDTFDCVLSCETLQHISKDDISDALFGAIRVSKKYIMVVERYRFPGEHFEPHMWTHDYVKLFEEMGVEVIQSTLIGQHSQGVIAVKRSI